MNVQDFLRGIEIIGKYDPTIKEADMSAGHDQIWVESSYERMSDEDKQEMEDLFWFLDEDSWTCYC